MQVPSKNYQIEQSDFGLNSKKNQDSNIKKNTFSFGFR
jgi:hypothetical protein